MESVITTRTTPEYQPNRDYLRVATATPEVAVADVSFNMTRIAELYGEAARQDVSLVVTPELSLTGYTLGDLVQSPGLLSDTEAALVELAELTDDYKTALVVGLPLRVAGGLYNCAALLAAGQIKGIVPKTNLPTYKEFYDKRWYRQWAGDIVDVKIGDHMTRFGADQLFKVGDASVGIEICEDLWVPDAPNVRLAAGGATVIVNPSASPELASKAAYRRQLVASAAGRLACAYVYAGADSSESTMDIVMSGHALISETGHSLAERAPFTIDQRLTIADIDLGHLAFDRLQNTNYPATPLPVVPTGVQAEQTDLRRRVDAHPFVPHGSPEQVRQRLDEVLTIQAVGLAERVKRSGIERVVLGLSGGLDSTLALLVAVQAARRLGVAPGELIETLTMPAVASSDRTQDNATRLAASLSIPNRRVPISELTDVQLSALAHGGEQDVTFENTQARLRTALLFNRANQVRGLVLGTGDLSEIALGWCTFGGDHLSHYNVNASVPKTLVRHLVRRAGELAKPDTRAVLDDILDTPVSPELTGDGQLGQQTEDILGPYELHDFFLYHYVRFMDPADKIAYLAEQAFAGQYDASTIHRHLATFITRFYGAQWKRSVMPDGPKVGTVSLSPRGDWRMPSDATTAARRDLKLIGAL